MVNNEQHFDDQNNDGYDEYDQPFDDGAAESTSLGQANSRTGLVIVGAAVLLIVVVFSIFSGGDEEVDTGDVDVVTVEKTEKSKSVRPEPASLGGFGNGDLGGGGTQEHVVIIPPPPETPYNPIAPILKMPTSITGSRGGMQDMFISEEAQERLSSPMFVSGGGSITGGSFFEGFGGDDPDEYANSSAESVRATKMHDPKFVIGMGKIIDAVMESAIDTGLGGMVRAIVSQDVYADQGRNKLIPKGSRMIGTYETEIARGQARVNIIWDRVIRPDGVDIKLESSATGLLGKAGIKAEVDNRYFEIFGSAIMLSSLEVGFAALGDAAIGGGQVDSGETGSGDATQTGDVTSISLLNAVNDFGNTVNSVAQGLVNLAPLLSLKQGTRFKVFVNRDVEFPINNSNGIQVLR